MLPRSDYDRLVALAAEAQEDASASRIVRNSIRALKEGREVVLPKAVVDRLANGDNPVRVIREWRDMIQGELAVAVGISQNYLSEIETGRRKGPCRIAEEIRPRAWRADGSADRMRLPFRMLGFGRNPLLRNPENHLNPALTKPPEIRR